MLEFKVIANLKANKDLTDILKEFKYNVKLGQTKTILQKFEKVLSELGASMNDVVRTRIFCTDISQWEKIGKAHGEFFSEIKPTTGMYQISKLISDDLLVEIEATAIIG